MIPTENKELLNKKYKCSGKEMEETWRECLTDQGKYIIITPNELLAPVNHMKYSDLIEYLDMLGGNQISVKTLDLGVSWEDIKAQLDSIVSYFIN